MHWADIAVISVIGLSVLISLFRGFVKEAISLATWIAAVVVAMLFSSRLASYLPVSIESGTVRVVIAFFVLFLITLIVGAIINYLISQMVSKTGLSGTDRLLGVIFGVARGGLIVAVLVLLAGLTNMPKESWWQSTRTLPFFEKIAVQVKDVMPADWQKWFEPEADA